MTERDDLPSVPDDPEVPAEDALDQHTEVVEVEDDDVRADPDLEADPADVAEQSRSVNVADDEYL